MGDGTQPFVWTGQVPLTHKPVNVLILIVTCVSAQGAECSKALTPVRICSEVGKTVPSDSRGSQRPFRCQVKKHVWCSTVISCPVCTNSAFQEHLPVWGAWVAEGFQGMEIKSVLC